MSEPKKTVLKLSGKMRVIPLDEEGVAADPEPEQETPPVKGVTPPLGPEVNSERRRKMIDDAAEAIAGCPMRCCSELMKVQYCTQARAVLVKFNLITQ